MRPIRNLDARFFHGVMGLAFLCGACALAFVIGQEIWLGHRARAFVLVSAELQHLELAVSRNGNGAVTECVRTRYRYAFGGRVLESDRVGTRQESSCDSSYAHMIHTRLHAAQQRGAPVMIWINPARPEEALLDREPRWGVIAGDCIGALMFATGGLVLSLRALRGSPVIGRGG